MNIIENLLMSLFQLWSDETSFSVQWIWSWNKISLGLWVKSSGEFGKARRVSRYIVKRIFLKWDGLWHIVSVQNVSKIISRKMLNMEIKQFYFLKPPSLQGRESFTANLLSLEKDFNEIEHTLSFSWFVKHQPANLQRIWIRFKSWAKTSSRKAHDKN